MFLETEATEDLLLNVPWDWAHSFAQRKEVIGLDFESL